MDPSIKRLRVKTLPPEHPRYWTEAEQFTKKALWDYEPEMYVERFKDAHKRGLQRAGARE